MDRREFLRTAAGLAGVTLLGCWDGVAAHPAGDRMLVAVHLFGGNDGLNTIAPVSDAAYTRARPTLGLRASEVVGLRRGLGWHPALAPLLPLWDRGRMAIVHGAGYDGPNRSHFRSSEIWQTAQVQGVPPYGWLGRCLDLMRAPGVSLDPSLSRALWSECSHPLCVRHPDTFRFADADPVVSQALDRMYAAGTVPSHLRLNYRSMRDAMRDLSRPLPMADGIPDHDFGKVLRTVLRLMPGARVYHVTLDGFDTHGGQKARHAKILCEMASGLAALWKVVEDRGLDDRTLVMIYSEFGRRVEENASGGTDHGAAGPMLLLGKHVRSGYHGDHPSLTDLDDGDLRHSIDFRRVYAAVLERWLETDAPRILGGRFDPLAVIG